MALSGLMTSRASSSPVLSLEHELRYKSDRNFSDSDAARLRLCSEAISEIDREMQDIYQGKEPSYHE